MGEIIERQKLAYQNMFYSIQRIDLLLISISGAGIYVCFEATKYLDSKNLCPSVWLKIAGGLFLLAIIINFLSQLTSYKSNQQDYLMCSMEAEGELSEEQQMQRDEYDRISEKFSNWTEHLNYLSVGFMFSGLLTLAVYFIFIF